MNARMRTPRLRPFDLTRYVGSEERGIPAPYTPAQILVLAAGAIGLLTALQVRGRVAVRKAAGAVSNYHRARFHARPNKIAD